MSRGRSWLIAILLVAFALRLTAAVAVQRHVGDQLCLIAGDATGYWELARRIADGDEFSLYQPPRRIHRMPGFPAVLALSLTLFGESTFAARCVLAVVGTLACGAVYLLGRSLFDELTALFACALTAVSPVMTGFSVLLLSETLFALMLTLSLWCAVRWLTNRGLPPLTPPSEGGEKPIFPPSKGGEEVISPPSEGGARGGWACATGVAIAAATYVRPSWLLAGPLLGALAILLSNNRRRIAIEAVVMLIALYGTLLPWAIRNYLICEHLVFTTLWSGPSVYDGLNPRASGESDMRFFDLDNLPATQSEYQVDQSYKEAAMQFAKDDPLRAGMLTLIKLWRYWKPWPNAEQFGGIGPAILVFVFFVPLCVCAIRGFWLARNQPWTWLLTAGPILYFAAIHSVFVGSLRYRLPAEYPLCVLAAVGLIATWKTWKLSRRTSLNDGTAGSAT